MGVHSSWHICLVLKPSLKASFPGQPGALVGVTGPPQWLLDSTSALSMHAHVFPQVHVSGLTTKFPGRPWPYGRHTCAVLSSSGAAPEQG